MRLCVFHLGIKTRLIAIGHQYPNLAGRPQLRRTDCEKGMSLVLWNLWCVGWIMRLSRPSVWQSRVRKPIAMWYAELLALFSWDVRIHCPTIWKIGLGSNGFYRNSPREEIIPLIHNVFKVWPWIAKLFESSSPKTTSMSWQWAKRRGWASKLLGKKL